MLNENDKVIRDCVNEFVLNVVKNEVKTLVSTSNKSAFKIGNINELSNISFDRQHQELQEKAPLLNDIVFAVAINPQIDKRNKIKNTESLILSVVNAVSTLLFCRDQHMNANATLNTIVL